MHLTCLLFQTYIDVFDHMNVQSAIRSLQLEIRHGVIELDVLQALANGFVDLCALLTLELGFLKIALQRVGRGIAII